MRSLLLVPSVLLAACTAPPATAPATQPAPPTRSAPATDAVRPAEAAPATEASFDAADWLARARALAPALDDLAYDTPADDPDLAAARALTDDLDRALRWGAVCDRYWSDEDQANRVYEGSEGMGFQRGIYTVHDVLAGGGAGTAVVTVQCDFGANTGTYVYVHIKGARAALLAGQRVGTDGAFDGPPSAKHYAEPVLSPLQPTFEVYEPSSAGSCGTIHKYRLGGLGEARLVQAFGFPCGGDGADLLDWPLVYPSE